MEVMTRKIVHYLEAVLWGCELTYQFFQSSESRGQLHFLWNGSPKLGESTNSSLESDIKLGLDGEMVQTVAEFNAKCGPLW